MPIYDFDCERCGPFEARLGLDESSGALDCPGCGTSARRVYSMPAFKALSAGQRKLRRIEERGSEPTVSAKPPVPQKPHRHARPGRPWQLGH